MHPLRGGKVNMMTGNREMGKVQKHIPTVRYSLNLYMKKVKSSSSSISYFKKL
jgi:hypothetical protein